MTPFTQALQSTGAVGLVCLVAGLVLANDEVDLTEGPTLAVLGARDEEIVVDLVRARANDDVFSEFKFRMDFEDRGHLSREPIEEGIRGIPDDVDVEYHGLFQMSLAKYASDREWPMWEPHDFSRPVDNQVSFITGFDGQGRQVAYFDSDNDEDFSDEQPVFPIDVNRLFRLLGQVIPGIPFGKVAEATVQFEYIDGDEVETSKALVGFARFEQWYSERDEPKIKGSVLEYRRGRLDLNGRTYDFALYNRGNGATYHLKRNRLIFDLDDDGVFDPDIESPECFYADAAFNIDGVSLQVKHVTPTGIRMLLARSDSTVAPKIELKAGVPAPDFTAIDIEGNEVRLSNYRGRHVLLDFWFTGCSPCIRDTPELKDIWENRSYDELAIIGIAQTRRRNGYDGTWSNTRSDGSRS